jgi:hypothetical protein
MKIMGSAWMEAVNTYFKVSSSHVTTRTNANHKIILSKVTFVSSQVSWLRKSANH